MSEIFDNNPTILDEPDALEEVNIEDIIPAKPTIDTAELNDHHIKLLDKIIYANRNSTHNCLCDKIRQLLCFTCIANTFSGSKYNSNDTPTHAVTGYE
jgi:hypothetical protein